MVVYRDDQLTKEEDIYDIFTVELVKKPGKGLGLSIVGKRNDVGVYISDIVSGFPNRSTVFSSFKCTDRVIIFILLILIKTNNE